MAGLSDEASGSYDLTLDVPPNILLASDGPPGIEREYLAHREAVAAMLRTEFPRLRDEVEELYQHAWAELLALRSGGEEIRNVRALLKRIAWYRARDVLQKRQPDYVDPAAAPLRLEPDDRPLPDEQAELRLDTAALRIALESLSPQQAAVVKLRYGLGLRPREIQKRLGIAPPRQNKLLNAAYRTLLAQLQPAAGEEPLLVRRQRSLLLACESQIATARQRQRAQRMVDQDLRCRLMLREMRATLRSSAALLPLPVLLQGEGVSRPLQSLFDHADQWWASALRLRYSLRTRLWADPVAADHAGGIGGAALGAGTAAKIVAICIAAGGTAAACLESAGLLLPPAHHHRHVARHPRVAERRAKPSHLVALTVASVSPPPKPVAAKRTTTTTAVSSPHYKPAPSPAPPGSTEFGPGNVGSTGASTQPAAAPADGGGEFLP